MNARQFLRSLKKQGIISETKRGTGHVALFNPVNGKRTVMPMHGARKQLGTGLMKAIRTQLGLL